MSNIWKAIALVTLGAVLGGLGVCAWDYEDRCTTDPRSVVEARESAKAAAGK